MRFRFLVDGANEHVILFSNGVFAHAALYQQHEFEIMVYTVGGRREAESATVHGGRLSPRFRARSLAFLQALLRKCQEVWQGRRVYFDASDPRKRRVYCKLAQAHGLPLSCEGGAVFSFTF